MFLPSASSMLIYIPSGTHGYEAWAVIHVQNTVALYPVERTDKLVEPWHIQALIVRRLANKLLPIKLPPLHIFSGWSCRRGAIIHLRDCVRRWCNGLHLRLHCVLPHCEVDRMAHYNPPTLLASSGWWRIVLPYSIYQYTIYHIPYTI